ncbi:reverse transcriptase domain-containing protein [Tanacetum coccineum]
MLLLLMPRFAPTIKSLLMNKEKLLELAKIPLNENWLGNAPQKVLLTRDPRFLLIFLLKSTAQIPPSVIPISISEPDVSTTLPKTTPISESDIPKSLPKPNIPYPSRHDDQKSRDKALNQMEKIFQIFQDLRFDISFADAYGEEITLRVDNEAEYVLELLGFSNSSSGNPTPTSEPFTSEFILEDIEAYLKDDSISPEIDHANCNPEEDICLIKKLLNNDPFQLPPMDLKQSEVTEAKSSIEEPPELELKDLPSHLEYAFLEENDKLPVIIAKEKMLKRYEDTNLVLNWEKCHFMCREGIVLGHKISKSGIEVDHVKVDVITKLPHPTTVKGTLKKKLTEAPILVIPNWNLPFELMCDASDFAIGAVLGQRNMKHFQPIHYASKTMTEA